MAGPPTDIATRKRDHIAICADGDVECIATGTLLDDVRFAHEALPEMCADEIDLSREFLGRRLALPLMITGMTGGHPDAIAINRELAEAAQRHRLAMGVGSQRATLVGASAPDDFRVRDFAPDAAIAANIGSVQRREVGPAAVEDLAWGIDADAICVHLNAAQELVQDKGDRDFRGGLDAIATLVDRAAIPVIVKETGCGLSARVARQLADAGVSWLDVAGAGGTSWTRVESHRGSPEQRSIGSVLADWGIPTAASIRFATGRGPSVIASGGIRDGLDVARGLALGATLGGMALPFLRAQQSSGREGLDALVARVTDELRAVCVLTSSRDLAALSNAPVHLGPELRSWLELDDRIPDPSNLRSRHGEDVPRSRS